MKKTDLLVWQKTLDERISVGYTKQNKRYFNKHGGRGNVQYVIEKSSYYRQDRDLVDDALRRFKGPAPTFLSNKTKGIDLGSRKPL